MAQRLIFPVNKPRITASFSDLKTTDPYYKRFGFYHYGNDFVDSNYSAIVYGCGNGTVVEKGFDNIVGNVLVVRYNDCISVDGVRKDLIVRIYHLSTIYVTKGQKITKDTKVGIMGNTGSTKGMAVHLHIEVDTDTAWPLYSPTVYNSSFLKGRLYGANAATIVPCVKWFHCKTNAPDNQKFTFNNDQFVKSSDRVVKTVTTTVA